MAFVPRLAAWILSKRTIRNREREVFLRVVEPTMTVLDIGANVGVYTQLFSRLVGTRGTVHAFEPIPPTNEILSRAVAHRANVRVHQFALGERAATLEMTVVAGDFGQASLMAHDSTDESDARAREVFSVPVASLDDLLKRGAITPPDLIKMDVEGAERMVLRGANALIAAHKPVLLFEVFEAWTRGFSYTPLDLLRDVEALGYSECYLLDSALRRLPLSRTMSRWPQSGPANVLALPSTPRGERARLRLAPLLDEAKRMDG